MNEELPSESSGGVVRALGLLRHALADPLSAAGLKLEILERRLAVAPEDVALADRVRGAKADLAVAGGLIDLLPRLAGIAGETPSESSIGDLCRSAGIPLEEDSGPHGPLLLRRLATIDALRALAGFLRTLDPGGAPPRARLETSPFAVSLRLEVPGTLGANAERLFRLPRGEAEAEGLFLARAGVESDGGRVEIVGREGLAAALLSWPVPVPVENAGGPA